MNNIKSSKERDDSASHHAFVAVHSSGSSTSSIKNNLGGRKKVKNNKNKYGNNGRNNNNRGNGGQSNARGSSNNNNNANRGRPDGISIYSDLSFSSILCVDFITNNLSSLGNNSSSGNLSFTPTSDTCGFCWFLSHQGALLPTMFQHYICSFCLE